MLVAVSTVMSFVVMFIMYVLQFHAAFGIRKEQLFYAGVLCDLELRRDVMGCSKHVLGITARHACVFKCGQDPTCIGASTVSKDKSCYHHYTCPYNTIPECTKREDDHVYVSKNCAHGGVWNPDTSSCACRNGWMGWHCLELPVTCQSLEGNPASFPDGKHRTYLTLRDSSNGASNASPPDSPVPAVCSVDGAWSATVTFSNSAKANFSFRTWNEYRNGFFVDFQNFWVGLKNWHHFSEAGFQQFIVFLNIGDTYIWYADFSVKDESNGFSFTFSSAATATRDGVANGFDDCFGNYQNFPFSAMDKDEDGVPGANCAEDVGGGWWFRTGSCLLDCNLLGVSPDAWQFVPEEQWMKIGGTHPSVLSTSTEEVSIRGYLRP